MHFSGSNLTAKSLELVDQSSRGLFRRTQEESIYKTSLFGLDILSHSGDIRGQSRTLQKIDRNFACFWPLKLSDLIGRFEPDFDHVAKFRADRTRGLEDVAV